MVSQGNGTVLVASAKNPGGAKQPSQSELIWSEQSKLNNAIFLMLNKVMNGSNKLNMESIISQADHFFVLSYNI